MVFKFEIDKCSIEEGQFKDDTLQGFGRSLDHKHFKIGLFNAESKMEGYGKKVRRDDNQFLQGVFKNDHLLESSHAMD